VRQVWFLVHGVFVLVLWVLDLLEEEFRVVLHDCLVRGDEYLVVVVLIGVVVVVGVDWHVDVRE